MALSAGPKTGASPLDLEDLPEDPGERALAFLGRCGITPYRWQEHAIRDFCVQTGGSGRHIYAVSDSERNLNSVLWREIVSLINDSPYLRNALYIFKNRLENPYNGSFLELRPGNFKASQGINPHLVLADEVHLIKPETWNGYLMSIAARGSIGDRCRRPRTAYIQCGRKNGKTTLSAMIALIEICLGSGDDPMVLGTTTPGYELSGVAHDLYQEAKEGSSDLYSIIFEPADPDCDIHDREAWARANPAMDEIPGLLASLEYDVTHTPENEFRRFRLGQWQAVAESWLPYGAFAACGTTRELQTDEEVWLGFDGSWSGDSTALVACTRDGHLQVLGHWFKPALLYTDWRVDIAEVEDAIRLACAKYKVVEVVCDPARWSRSLQALQNEGLPMVEMPQSPARMIPATSRYFDAVLDRQLTWCKVKDHHGKAFETHIANARVRQSAAGVQIAKADKNSPSRIDIAVAAIMAHDRATRAKTKAPLRVEWF